MHENSIFLSRLYNHTLNNSLKDENIIQKPVYDHLSCFLIGYRYEVWSASDNRFYLVAKDSFTYTFEADSNGFKGYAVAREFYTDWNTTDLENPIHDTEKDYLIYSETLDSVYMSTVDIGNLFKDAQNCILIALVKTITDPTLSAIVKQIIGWYNAEIESFRHYGYLDIISAIENEVDTDRLTILDIKPFGDVDGHPNKNMTIADNVAARFNAYKSFLNIS